MIKRIRSKSGIGGRRGRPSGYDPRYAMTAKELCRLGATDADLAAAFGVTIPTIWAWRNKYRDFFDALKGGKDAYDDLVERSLAQRAMGYSYDAEEIKIIGTRVVRVTVRKHMPPDTTACIFWLKNRRPQEWREVARFEHTGRDGKPIEIDDNARAEIERRIASIAARIGAETGLTRPN